MAISIRKTAALAVLVLALTGGAAWARGEEHFGNEPLGEANYAAWPGIAGVVNHPSRVYHYWVNGNEQFYYHGDTAALNDVLRRFATVVGDGKKVVLRPGPGTAMSFSRDKAIPFGWDLQIVGGVSAHLATHDQGDKVWSPHPVLSIYVGGGVDLQKLEIPRGLTVAPVVEVSKRAREALKSKDKTVRGWGAGVLAALDRYDAANQAAVAALLKDEDEWVRLNAVMALQTFGTKAQPALPLLREALDTKDERLKTEVQNSINAIEKAREDAAAERKHAEMLKQIDQFLAARKK